MNTSSIPVNLVEQAKKAYANPDTWFVPITEASFVNVEQRIFAEAHATGELRDMEDPHLPKMTLQCFEELTFPKSVLFTREQMRAIWLVLTSEQQQAIVDGLNEKKAWY